MASSLDAQKVPEISTPSTANDQTYVATQSTQLFRQGMSFSGHERDKLWLNAGANGFADLSDMSGSDSPNDGRAVIAADFDDDGDVDLFVHNIQRERHALYRNDVRPPGSADGRFVKVRLRATRSQHEAIGAVVVARNASGVSAQVLSRGAGFASCQPPELIFGLGTAASTEIEVIWPGAKRESFGTLAAGARALLVEGTGKPEPFAARPRPLPDPLPAGLRVARGGVVPPLTLVDSAGRPALLDVAALAQDKPVWLNFWASYCAPCVAEIPELQRAAESGTARVVAIGLDAPAERASAHALLTARGGRFDAYYLAPSETDVAAGLAALVDLERLPIPTTIVVAPGGRIESILRGPIGPK